MPVAVPSLIDTGLSCGVATERWSVLVSPAGGDLGWGLDLIS